MSKSVALFVVVLVAGALSVAPQTQTRVPVPEALAVRTAAGESLSVIVGVNATFVPEGGLDRAAAADQRAAVARVTDDVMARVVDAGITVGTRLDFLPFFTARVDRTTLDRLATTPGVVSIEVNELSSPTLLSSVPITNAPAAWTAGFTGTGWKVAILDTGVEKTHSFLTGKVTDEACYANAGGTGTGTSTCPGGGFASTAVGSGVPCVAASGCDHGTHVAGIAGGANGPGGATGVGRGASLVAMNVFTRFDDASSCGSTPTPCALSYASDQVLALNRVAALAGAGQQIASVNMSLGGGNYSSQATCDSDNTTNGRKAAIDNLRSIGVPVVAASGNNGFRTSMSSPACISSAVSVGSINDNGTVSSFSNNAAFLSLYAPGSSIVSSVPGNAFESKDGTSMATPHVAGAWAILKQAAPSATIAQVLSALQSTGTSISDTRSGGGTAHPLINVNAARLALQGSGGVPLAPTGFTAQVNGNALSLSWGAAPGATAYTLVVRLASGGPVYTTFPLGAVTSFSVSAPNGVYFLSVVGTNSTGTGPESSVAQVTIPAVPAVPNNPTNLTVGVAGSTVTFQWSAPAAGGPVGEYVLMASTTPGFATPLVSLPVAAPATSVTVPGVPPGRYYARVYARNSGGNSASASNEVTLDVAGPSAPGAPVLNTPGVAGGVVSLSWSAGGGGTPASYTLYASLTPGGAPIATVPLAGTSVSFGGVPAGTYYLRMTASNAIGTSGLSNQVTLVVP